MDVMKEGSEELSVGGIGLDEDVLVVEVLGLVKGDVLWEVFDLVDEGIG